MRYELLGNVLAIETEVSLAGEGILIGMGFGTVMTLSLAAIAYLSDYRKTDVFDWRSSVIRYYGTLFIGAGATIGGMAGAKKAKFKKYRYSKEQFKNNPFYISDMGDE